MEVLNWRNTNPGVHYFFSSDIREEWKLAKPNATFLEKGDVVDRNGMRIEAFGSTDIGISFLITADNRQIFHAGDLNNWHWTDISTPEEIAGADAAYLHELDLLAQRTEHLDLAMLPVDPRLGKEYMKGAEQFVGRIRTDILAPMHFGRSYDKAAAFKSFAEKHHCRLFEIAHKGQQIDI
jgi:L-ascorbate metabolism protein UlaG (beta-lactamase superfamily)